MCLVRLLKGKWYKSEQGVWRFNRDASLYGEDIILAENATMNDLEGLVRGVFNLTTTTPLLITFKLQQSMVEPEGQTSPPHNIVAKTDVEMLLRIHDWNTEPQLCVIFGAKAVAKYQCICRTPFKIGNRYFLGEGITEEQHMFAINAFTADMVGGQELVCSYQVLKEIFSENEMVSLYRFSLEIEMLTNLLDLNIGAANITTDHVVRHPIHLNGMAPRSNNANQQERAGRLAHSYEADMYGFPSGGWTMNRLPSADGDGWEGDFVPNVNISYNTRPTTYCIEGERRAMRGPIGSMPTATELVPPLTFEVGSSSVQLNSVRRNELYADVPPVQFFNPTDGTEKTA